MMDRTVRPFSAGYFMIDADVVEHSGDNAIVAHDYFDELVNFTTRPLLRYGTEHYWAWPEHGVPSDTIALPDGDLPASDAVLMAKDETAERLVAAGEQPRP
jgi:hypothetical protein